MIERSRRVVLLIDYDNLQICASRDTPGRELQLTPVVQLAQRYGTVILARAYAEWNLSTERLAVYKAGIEPAFAPVLRTESDRSGKSLADTVMVAEGMDMLWTLSPEVVVLATSDKDLIPLVRVAKQRGAFVVVLGSDFTAIPLREMADEHVTYKQLITDSQGRYVTEATPARAPAALSEPAHRRPTRERNGRERAPSTSPAATPPIAAIAAPARIERESPAAPAFTPSTGTASVAATPVESVAALTVGTSSDGDAQALGRRRRRRGSRRRTERIGGVGEGIPSFEVEPESEGAYADESDAPELEELGATAEASLAQAVEAPMAPRSTLDTPTLEPDAPGAEVVATVLAAPRNRRRTARRPLVDAVLAAAEPAPITSEDSVATPSPLFGETPDILWAAEFTPTNGSPPPVAAEAALADGEPATEDAVVTPRPRPRRIASAARGRTRPATSR
ncbi:MAG: NYN domain-containing protein [Chloroflexota bacterium]